MRRLTRYARLIANAGRAWLISWMEEPDRAFAARISLLISFLFAGKCYLYNWAEPHLTTLVRDGEHIGATSYPLGHWVCLVAIPLFLCNCRILLFNVSPLAKGVLLLSFSSLTAFIMTRLIFLNTGFVGFVAQGVAICVFAIWIRYWNHEAPPDAEAHAQSNMEYIKESCSFWRTFVLGASFGFCWFLPSWHAVMVDTHVRHVCSAAKAEVHIVEDVVNFQIFFLFVVVVFAPIWQALRRYQQAHRLLRECQQLGVRSDPDN